MEYGWYDNDGGKSKYSEKNLSQRHFDQHNFPSTGPGSTKGLCGGKSAADHPSHGTAFEDDN
jgi:hypothetical protein